MIKLRWPKDATQVRNYSNYIFSKIAIRYDVTKFLLSFGQEKRWKEKALRPVICGREGVWIDLASGTGDVLGYIYQEGSCSSVFALDLRPEMLRKAVQEYPHIQGRCVVGDLNYLPIKSESVDTVSVAYGLRYIVDLEAFCLEVYRVLKPEGRFISFDLGHPHWLLRPLWYGYLLCSGTIIGTLLHRDPTTYWHLVQSLRAYPGQKKVAEYLKNSGFVEVRTTPLVFGTMAVHTCVKDKNEQN